MRNRFRCQKGVTLMDLMVSITVMGIMTGVVGMNWGLSHGLQLKSGTRQVMTDLRLARAKAIAQGTAFQVTFSSGLGSYAVRRLVPGSSPAVWEDYALYGRGNGAITPGTPQPVDLPEGVTILTSETITFRPRGSATFCTDCTGQVQLTHPLVPEAKRVTTFLNGLIQIG